MLTPPRILSRVTRLRLLRLRQYRPHLRTPASHAAARTARHRHVPPGRRLIGWRLRYPCYDGEHGIAEAQYGYHSLPHFCFLTLASYRVKPFEAGKRI